MAHSTNELAQSVSSAVEALVANLCVSHQQRGSNAAQPPPLRLAVALSGGRDSVVLLHALSKACTTAHVTLTAIHVHHGLSRNADAWARFCASECARLGVPLRVERVEVVSKGGESIEALARTRRFEALRACNADIIALAHHADDQAETLLLQLLRGAGPHGLAAMPEQSTGRERARLVRPFLELPPQTLAAYAELNALRWIEDESNVDTRFRRNALRHDVAPILRAAFPGYPTTLVRAARHQAEAAALLDDLARLDAEDVALDDVPFGLCLDRLALRAIASTRPARARNLLRWFLRAHDLPSPSTACLAEMLAQCTTARADSRVRIHHAGAEIALHTGRVVVHRALPESHFSLPWHGEERIDCPGGILHATRRVGGGIAATLVDAGSLRLRPRVGGERLHVGNDRPRQAVSDFFNRTATPLWQRDHWPLVWHERALVAVPGLGVDPTYAAPPETTGYELRWSPAA